MPDQVVPEQERDGYIRRSISLYPVQDATITALAKDSGVANYSAALRMIINQWLQYEAARVGSSGGSAWWLGVGGLQGEK